MTLVHINLQKYGPDGRTGATGRMIFQPTKRHLDGSIILLPAPFAIDLDNGEATVRLDPCEGELWAWRIIEPEPTYYTHTVEVPDTTETVEYTDLIDIPTNATPTAHDWYTQITTYLNQIVASTEKRLNNQLETDLKQTADEITKSNALHLDGKMDEVNTTIDGYLNTTTTTINAALTTNQQQIDTALAESTETINAAVQMAQTAASRVLSIHNVYTSVTDPSEDPDITLTRDDLWLEVTELDWYTRYVGEPNASASELVEIEPQLKLIHRWTGTEWEDVQIDAATAISAGSITSDLVSGDFFDAAADDGESADTVSATAPADTESADVETADPADDTTADASPDTDES